MNDRNPQAHQMGDVSMFENLALQALAIWPQERTLFERYGLSGPIRVLDVGCGTGEITRRLAERYPEARVTGIDVLDTSLQIARHGARPLGERVQFEHGDAFALQYPDAAMDLVVCRHVSQSIPDFDAALAEMTRCLKPGGWLHLLSEDYTMLKFPRRAGDPDPDRVWLDTAVTYLESTRCDGRIGRHSWGLMRALGYEELQVDYAIVDTVRASRPIFAGILRAWRDGYSEVLSQASGKPIEWVRENFDRFARQIEDPAEYAVWHVPIVSGRKP